VTEDKSEILSFKMLTLAPVELVMESPANLLDCCCKVESLAVVIEVSDGCMVDEEGEEEEEEEAAKEYC
jgi:hypothetical protein